MAGSKVRTGGYYANRLDPTEIVVVKFLQQDDDNGEIVSYHEVGVRSMRQLQVDDFLAAYERIRT